MPNTESYEVGFIKDTVCQMLQNTQKLISIIEKGHIITNTGIDILKGKGENEIKQISSKLHEVQEILVKVGGMYACTERRIPLEIPS